MPKAVLVSTSATVLGSHPTGLWIEELAAPYYKFKDAGYEVAIASIKGGPIAIDAGSMGDGFFTDDCKKFMHDGAAVGALSHSLPIDGLSLDGVNVLFLCGGHGTAVDFVDNAVLKGLIEKQYSSGNIMATVCHGPVALAQCNKPDGTPLVQGLAVTGFSNSEEDAVGLSSAVPFMLETKFKEQGGNYEKGDDWNSKVCVAGKLITGQNPQSSVATAAACIAAVA